MKKFEFRLERIQKLRERTREQRKLALAEAIQYRQRVEEQIKQLNQVRAEEKESLRQALSRGPVTIEDVIRSQTFDGLLGRFSLQLGNQLQQLDVVVDQRRAQLMEAEKSVRILEKLEEKQLDRHERAEEHAERQMLDELAAAADLRKRMAP